MWENACFLELLRRGKRPDFWLDAKGEVDFVTDSELIQVCLDLHEGNEAMNHMPEKKPIIWTREQSGEVDPETGIVLRSGLLLML